MHRTLSEQTITAPGHLVWGAWACQAAVCSANMRFAHGASSLLLAALSLHNLDVVVQANIRFAHGASSLLLAALALHNLDVVVQANILRDGYTLMVFNHGNLGL